MAEEMSSEAEKAIEEIAREDLKKTHAWGADVVARGATLMHRAHLVIGKAKKYYDGEVEVSGLDCPVIEMDDGNTFVASHDAFVELDETAIAALNTTRAIVRGTIGGMLTGMHARGLDERRGIEVLIAVMRAQLHQVELARAKMEG
jgi:hypothetical protein